MSDFMQWLKLKKEGVEFRQRAAHDFYPTNYEHAKTGVDIAKPNPEWVLDAGMGAGIYGECVKQRFPDCQLVGIEIRLEAMFTKWYDWHIRGDFLQMKSDKPMFDLIIGNPPYNLAVDFVYKSLSLLKTGGELIYLLRLSFAESLSRYQLFAHEHTPKKIVVCSDRPSFIPDDETGGTTAYAYFVWEKGYQGACGVEWVVSRKRNQKHTYYQPSLINAPNGG